MLRYQCEKIQGVSCRRHFLSISTDEGKGRQKIKTQKWDAPVNCGERNLNGILGLHKTERSIK